MADPYDECPPYVRGKSWSLDTLVALKPYQSVADHEVAVPPIADPEEPFVEALVGGGTTTLPGGVKPEGKPPGWWERAEQDEKKRLRDLAREILTRDDAGQLAPQVRDLVRRLVLRAQEDLDQVDALYRAWSKHGMWAKESGDPFSCWSLHKGEREVGGETVQWGYCPLSLANSWQYLASQVLWPSPGDETANAFGFFDGLLQGERGSYQIGDPEPYQLMEAMVDARRRDREKIRDLFKHAYASLWCAEYGIAQGESYLENKRLWEERYGDLPRLKTPEAPTGPPGPGATAPSKLASRPKDPCKDLGINCPPWGGTSEGAPAPPPPLPDQQPVPASPTPRAWYQTWAGKLAIGAVGLSVLGAAGYAGFKHWRARA